MHQTFYIDIDEEITSIVDRLRRAKSQEIIIVVPKRALLIQSIVNLKLLKKESENLRKQIIIVTQDKLGKLLVEKAGITIEQKPSDVYDEEVSFKEEGVVPESEMKRLSQEIKNKEKLDNMGSEEYFEEKVNKKARVFDKKINGDIKGEEVEKITNKELVTDIGTNTRNKKTFFKKTSSMDIVKNVDGERLRSDNALERKDAPENEKDFFNTKDDKIISEKTNGFYVKETTGSEKIKNFFQSERVIKRTKEEANYKNINLSRNFWKPLVVFGGAAVIIIGLAAAYLFLPKANIKLYARAKTQSVDMQIKGDCEIVVSNQDNLTIPAKIITLNEEAWKTFDTTGNKPATNQKAHGTITVYNEYSGKVQPLVATTRFLSENGKIFRLTKNIMVPGTTKVGEEIKPGAIETEVIADESGEDYNIEPTTFSIPGFQGSGNEKYSKFYAKSSKTMAGGKKGEDTIKSISVNDIENAKKLLEIEIKQTLKQKIKNEAGQDSIVLDDAINFENATYSFSNSEGEAVSNFSGTTKIRAKAIVFNRSDVNKLAIVQLNKEQSAGVMPIDEGSLSLEFGKADVDFAKNIIVIRVHVVGKTAVDIDLLNLKKGILGKSEEDFKKYLKIYPQIENAKIEYWPSFFEGKIPAYKSRLNITLDNK
jgi:hypothetical protein